MTHYGADYYPEHWPEERWETDARLMREAGFNVVRIGEFAWAKLEPKEGEFDFDWLDRAIALFDSYGIKTVLGTPTATPPAWLSNRHPEILRVDDKGVRAIHGSRRHVCLANSVYREYTKEIIDRLGRRYGRNPAVIGWQIDNEFGCHGTARCYCDSCRSAWQAWLKSRYGTLDALNQKWGTVFWSQAYSEWEQIPVPLAAVPAQHHPSLVLDFYRFSSDVNVAYQKIQVNLLRSLTRDQFITHNFMGMFGEIDYYDLAEDLDFVSWDNYPRFLDRYDPVQVALSHDATRSFKRENFWVMEEQAGPTGQDTIYSKPYPGEIRLWAYQAIAHGADGIVYFRWRTCLFGQEQHWHGILDHDGVPRSRFAEVKQVGEELQRLAPYLDGTSPRPEVGIVYSFDNRWAYDIQPHNEAFSYLGHLFDYYRYFHEKHVGVNLVKPGANLEGYKVLVVPMLLMLTPEFAGQLETFVEKGGMLVVTFRSGVKNWENVVTGETPPGALRRLVGGDVWEYSPVASGERVRVRGQGEILRGHFGRAKAWIDGLEPEGAEVIATAADGPIAGRPVILANRVAAGCVLYIGTWLERDLLTRLLDGFLPLDESDIKASPGISLVRRSDSKSGRTLLFALNPRADMGRVVVPRGAEPLIGQVANDGATAVPPFGLAVFLLP